MEYAVKKDIELALVSSLWLLWTILLAAVVWVSETPTTNKNSCSYIIHSVANNVLAFMWYKTLLTTEPDIQSVTKSLYVHIGMHVWIILYTYNNRCIHIHVTVGLFHLFIKYKRSFFFSVQTPLCLGRFRSEIAKDELRIQCYSFVHIRMEKESFRFLPLAALAKARLPEYSPGSTPVVELLRDALDFSNRLLQKDFLWKFDQKATSVKNALTEP